MNLMDAMLGHRRLTEMGFSTEAIRVALSELEYHTESEVIDACRRVQDQLNQKGEAMSLTYTPPEPIGHSFSTGEIVDVCDRDLSVMSRVKVARAGKQVVRLVDGRRFRASDGWWIGETGIWPFPSIRHQSHAVGGGNP